MGETLTVDYIFGPTDLSPNLAQQLDESNFFVLLGLKTQHKSPILMIDFLRWPSTVMKRDDLLLENSGHKFHHAQTCESH